MTTKDRQSHRGPGPVAVCNVYSSVCAALCVWLHPILHVVKIRQTSKGIRRTRNLKFKIPKICDQSKKRPKRNVK